MQKYKKKVKNTFKKAKMQKSQKDFLKIKNAKKAFKKQKILLKKGKRLF